MLANLVIPCGYGIVPILGNLIVATFGYGSRISMFEEYLTGMDRGELPSITIPPPPTFIRNR